MCEILFWFISYVLTYYMLWNFNCAKINFYVGFLFIHISYLYRKVPHCIILNLITDSFIFGISLS
jgi:hypothetical protein